MGTAWSRQVKGAITFLHAMKRAMARQAEAEREKRAKIIAAEGELLAVDSLSQAAIIMERHPVTLQLRTLQTLAEIAVDKNSTVVFPAPLMTTIQELGAFFAREAAAVPTLAGKARELSPDTDGVASRNGHL